MPRPFTVRANSTHHFLAHNFELVSAFSTSAVLSVVRRFLGAGACQGFQNLGPSCGSSQAARAPSSAPSVEGKQHK